MKTLSTLILFLFAGTSMAAPAHYWKWRSKLDGKIVCSQTPLGAGWEKADGPYQDAQCGKALRPR